MTKALLKFPARRVSYLPRISSRRLGFKHFINAAYKSDGAADATDAPTAAEPTAAELAFLQKVRDQVKEEMQLRSAVTTEEQRTFVAGVIADSLKGLDVASLRSFDPKKLDDKILKLTSEFQRIRKAPLLSDERMNAIKEVLQDENTMKIVERAFNARTGTPAEINVRAALAVLTTGTAVDDTNVPTDILESFSIDSFVKKRRGQQFIYEIVNRRIVAKLTEYKTWMEEGDEQGAFALVAQGAVKPLTSFTLVRNESKYFKVAGKRVYTEEFVKFRQEAYGIIEDLFNDKLLRDYAAILVVRLNTAAASYVGTTLDAQYTLPTDYHAIGAVSAQIESLNFQPDLLIMHPQDKWRIGLSQNSQGSFYVNIPVYNPSGEVTLMGFKVITSTYCPVGHAYLGESRLYKVEEEPVSVRLGYGINVATTTISGTVVVTAVDSDVDTNRFRIIAELFANSYIASNNLGSFVYFSFATVKAALLKP